MKSKLKNTIANFRPLLKLMQFTFDEYPRVLVYHRFSGPEMTMPHRVKADEFAWQLDLITRNFNVTSLGECVGHFTEHGRWPRRTVVITVDDGYRDFYDWAFPELQKRGLKATFFVTVNFIEQLIWLWPDRLDYALTKTEKREFSARLHGTKRTFALGDHDLKQSAWHALSAYCISVPDDEKWEIIRTVEDQLEVSVPNSPTEAYASVTWEELKSMHEQGIEIGSHTMNHPILSRIPEGRLSEEIMGSRQSIREKLDCSVATFCYPNSAPADITERVVETVRQSGYSSAVFGGDLTAWDRYRIPRFGVSNDKKDFVWKLFGGEMLTQVVKRAT